MNRQLLEKVAAHIEAEPRRAAMERFVYARIIGSYFTDILAQEDATQIPECDTIACIGGWGQILNAPDPQAALNDLDFMKYRVAAMGTQEICDLFEITMAQAYNLCYLEYWPLDYWARYRQAYFESDQVRMGLVVADRIRFFLATDGTDEGQSVFDLTGPNDGQDMIRQQNERSSVPTDPCWMRNPNTGQWREIEDVLDEDEGREEIEAEQIEAARDVVS